MNKDSQQESNKDAGNAQTSLQASNPETGKTQQDDSNGTSLVAYPNPGYESGRDHLKNVNEAL